MIHLALWLASFLFLLWLVVVVVSNLNDLRQLRKMLKQSYVPAGWRTAQREYNEKILRQAAALRSV